MSMILKKIAFGALVIVISAVWIIFAARELFAQETVDQIVATVYDKSSDSKLITYSDLLWQLALEPDTPINPPNFEDLNRALQILVNMRLFALEAQRLPSSEPSNIEIDDEIKRILGTFKSSDDFQKRLQLVGFDSKDDDNFQRMMKERVAIEKYIDFRFRSFVIVTQDEEKKYYREVYSPNFRKLNPGLLLPQFDEVRVEINKTLVETKIEQDIRKFLDDAENRSEVTYFKEFK